MSVELSERTPNQHAPADAHQGKLEQTVSCLKRLSGCQLSIRRRSSSIGCQNVKFLSANFLIEKLLSVVCTR